MTQEPDMLNIRDFGATGDGRTDDTAAIQAALDQAGKKPGTVVHVPIGNYLLKSRLDMPEYTTLEGVWRMPTARSWEKGSTLLAVGDAGNPDAPPLIQMRNETTLKGVTIFYPEQTETNPPVAYPYTVASDGGDNISIIDCLFVNPYQMVDFGSQRAGRHYIRNLYGQPLYRGIFVDHCLDVGRLENIHLWPFWKFHGESPLYHFMRDNAIAFIFGRTDWEYVTNCFSIFYHIGFKFMKFENGPGNVLLTQSGADIGPIAVLVEDSQPHAGIMFNNSNIYGDIIVEASNTGPVKFTSCGIYGSTDGARGYSHAKLNGVGQTSFVNCHFHRIDPGNSQQRMIQVDGGHLSIQGCEFMDADREHIVLMEGTQSAMILGNRFNGKATITNNSPAPVAIANNLEVASQHITTSDLDT